MSDTKRDAAGAAQTGEEQTARQEDVVRLFMKHRASLFAFALAVSRDFQFAEDVLQEVAVVICEQWADYTPGTNFAAWARQITRNKMYSMSRSAQRSMPLAPEALDAFDSAAGRLDSGEGTDAELLDALRQCVQQLGDRARKIVVLRYQDGLDCSQVAERVNTTAPAIHMALTRIRGKLADCINARMGRERPRRGSGAVQT